MVYLGSPPDQIVDDQDRQRYDHEQVHQVAGDVQDKTQEPKNEEYRNYRAKHADQIAFSAVIGVNSLTTVMNWLSDS